MLDKGMSVIAGLACRVCMKVTAQYCTSYGRMMLINSTAPPMMIPLDTLIGSPMFPCTRAVSNPSGHNSMLACGRWPEQPDFAIGVPCSADGCPDVRGGGEVR
jgi:hypothetical protein